jgi:hypothetical protein
MDEARTIRFYVAPVLFPDIAWFNLTIQPVILSHLEIDKLSSPKATYVG